MLRVRADGRVRAMRIVMRGGHLTYRRSAGLLGDDDAAAGYAALFRRAQFDAICPRVFAGGRWINPMEVDSNAA